jgi:hypothetical protein
MNAKDHREFVQNVRKYRALIHNMKDVFITKIAEIGKSDESIDMLIFDSIFYEAPEVSETEFEMLGTYVHNIKSKNIWGDNPNNISDKLAISVLLLGNSELSALSTDTDNIVVKFFLARIMDLYIPSEYPDEVVKAFTAILSLNDVINNPYNNPYVAGKLNEMNIDGITADIADILELYCRVSDILLHRDIRIQAFIDWHTMFTKTAFKISALRNAICDRYLKYFSDDITLMVADLLDFFVSYNDEDELQTNIVDFIQSTTDGFNNENKLSVIKCLISDTLELASLNMDACRYTTIKDTIRKIFTKGYMSIPDKKTTANESGSKLTSSNGLSAAIEAYKKDSVAIHKGETAIYSAYKKYKNAEDKIDTQLSKAVDGMKNVLIGDVRTEIIEGKKFSAIGLLKKILGTIGLFSIAPIKALCAILIRYALKKNTTVSERRKIILELEAELEMINEKIDDARSDGDREAKYSMMRTRTELQNALARIRYGLEADEKSIATAKHVIGLSRK